MKPDSIILDIDGTLWDSTPIVAAAWNEAVRANPHISLQFTAQDLKQLFGRPLPAIADLAFPSLPEQERYALIDDCCLREHTALSASDQDLLFPGVADTIRRLSKKYPLFIVSNCQSGYIELFLEKSGLASCITDFECPGSTGFSKGKNIRLVMERNHLKHSVYVGDIEGDQKASKEAGIPFCHAAYGFGTVQNPDFSIQSFPELLTLFDEQYQSVP